MSSIINKYGSFVKEQIEHNDRSATKFRSDEKRANAYQTRAAVFRQMLADLEADVRNGASSSSPSSLSSESLYRLTSGEIQDLPLELLEQLSLTEGDKQEFFYAELIEKLGGATSIDKLLIAIYRKNGEVEKRTKLNARLYRMMNKGMIFVHPTRKGVYGLKPFVEDEGQSDFFEEDRQPDD